MVREKGVVKKEGGPEGKEGEERRLSVKATKE